MMTKDETFSGWANRETWAFMLHISNDEGLYNETREEASRFLGSVTEEDTTDYRLGENVAGYWAEVLEEWRSGEYDAPTPEALAMFEREVGSWWRIDYREVGEAVRDMLS